MAKRISDWRVEVTIRKGFIDPIGRAALHDIEPLGVSGVEDVRMVHVFLVSGPFSERDMDRVASRLLCDPVNQTYSIKGPVASPGKGKPKVVQVFRKPGVMDPVAMSAMKGMADLGLSAHSVRTGRKFLIYGKTRQSDLKLIADTALHNAAIEDVFYGDVEIPHSPDSPGYVFKRREVSLLGVSDARLMEISRDMTLSLNLEEMRTIQNYFSEQDRNPTDVELETLAQTWSEHCVHKTLKGVIEMDGKRIDNLLKSTVARVTRELDKPWCVSVFVDNAGIIEFDENFNVCFKVETHNHPSAIEPYGGAGTGIGGVIRDTVGTGMGARPILNTDVFCFGPPDLPRNKVYPGALHPMRVMKGVVSGVRDYGNRMGIPTANGAVLFDDRYIGNPLVYCGNVGILPRDKCFKKAHPGDLIVVVGGRTGRDGIHGATFSSAELTEESESVSSGAVQIGNAIRGEAHHGHHPAGPRPGPVHMHHRLRRGRTLQRGGRDGRGDWRGSAPREGAHQVRRPALRRDLDLRGAGAHGHRRAAEEPPEDSGALQGGECGSHGDRQVLQRQKAAALLQQAQGGGTGHGLPP